MSSRLGQNKGYMNIVNLFVEQKLGLEVVFQTTKLFVLPLNSSQCSVPVSSFPLRPLFRWRSKYDSFLVVSGEVPREPVISKKTGYIYEKSLITK